MGNLMGPARKPEQSLFDSLSKPEATELRKLFATEDDLALIQATTELFPTAVSMLTKRDKKFKASVRAVHHQLEGKLAQVRDDMKPLRDKEAAIRKELDRIDETIMIAWDAGARSADSSIDVVEEPEAKRWSKGIVEGVAAALGKTYEQLERLARFGTKRSVKLYR